MASRILLGVCAVLMAVALVNVASGEPASVVLGLAKCADCTRKNMKAEAAFKGLQVAIKCKNKNGEYESKAFGKLDGSGAFSVPLSTDLHGADCHAQLHSASGKPCPGQEPSTLVPQSEGTFIAIDHFHKKPVPEYNPVPEYHPVPEHKPEPEYHPPTPEYHPPTPTYGGSPTPIYHPPALRASATFCGKIKKHIIDHFHKKPVPPKPMPEYHPPKPEYHPPTPTYGGSSTPIYHPPSLRTSSTFCGKIKKHFFDHFHKKPVSEYKPVPEYYPVPEHKPVPEYHPPTPVYGQPKPTPIYHPPVKN
ncbi:hypothetical protein EJB05_22998 [Eragrostis curvula]|uniref:Proline-rich protein n=1 Tax=Eragrostis curvula TaxID=38414 RepID=A0A5J9V5W9_9POAL|nr:hypothetical protein EJB05_22998 [Eragrostis curvula]